MKKRAVSDKIQKWFWRRDKDRRVIVYNMLTSSSSPSDHYNYFILLDLSLSTLLVNDFFFIFRLGWFVHIHIKIPDCLWSFLAYGFICDQDDQWNHPPLILLNCLIASISRVQLYHFHLSDGLLLIDLSVHVGKNLKLCINAFASQGLISIILDHLFFNEFRLHRVH